MSVHSVLLGWKCDCGVNRNTVNEVWRDCVCKKQLSKQEVEKSNNTYWNNFWGK